MSDYLLRVIAIHFFPSGTFITTPNGFHCVVDDKGRAICTADSVTAISLEEANIPPGSRATLSDGTVYVLHPTEHWLLHLRPEEHHRAPTPIAIEEPETGVSPVPVTDDETIHGERFMRLPRDSYSFGGGQGRPLEAGPAVFRVRATDALLGNVEDPDLPAFVLPDDGKKHQKATLRIGIDGFGSAGQHNIKTSGGAVFSRKKLAERFAKAVKEKMEASREAGAPLKIGDKEITFEELVFDQVRWVTQGSVQLDLGIIGSL